MMASATLPTLHAARPGANGAAVRPRTDSVHAAHTRVHPPALWPVRNAAAYAFSQVASDKVLARALQLTRTTVSRWRNYATMPVSECAVVLYLMALKGLDTSPVLAVLMRAAERGRAEHDRRAGLSRRRA